MSIDHLKKQAKNLKAALPAFLQLHPSGVAPLASFQELVAQISGYPSWHAASRGRSGATDDIGNRKPALSLGITVAFERMYVTEYTADGSEKPSREVRCAVFYPDDQAAHERSVDQLDGFIEEYGSSEEFGDDGPPAHHSRELKGLCSKLVASDHSFIDGHAHLCIALWRLGDFQAAINAGRPVYDQLCAMLPRPFSGRVPYHHLENRPFHRLSHVLVLAYYGLKTLEGDREALLLAKRMLKWWPNDNLGFRFLLEPDRGE